MKKEAFKISHEHHVPSKFERASVTVLRKEFVGEPGGETERERRDIVINFVKSLGEKKDQ
jgi:hypothetical protein